MSIYLIDVEHACYWIEVQDGRVVKAPPIARWMIGKPATTIVDWVERKGGTVDRV